MNKLANVVTIVLLAAAAATVYAQGGTGGCVSSPENPTAVLALVGAAGAGLSYLRMRLGRK